MIIQPLFPDSISHVIYNLRADDRTEFNAMGFDIVPVRYYVGLLTDAPAGFVAHDDHGEPIAVCTAHSSPTTTRGITFWSTARFAEIAYPLSAYIKGKFIPSVVAQGAMRAEVRSLKGLRDTGEWLRWLGFRDVVELPKYGINGETFILWEMLDDDVWQPSRCGVGQQAAAPAAPASGSIDRQRVFPAGRA